MARPVLSSQPRIAPQGGRSTQRFGAAALPGRLGRSVWEGRFSSHQAAKRGCQALQRCALAMPRVSCRTACPTADRSVRQRGGGTDACPCTGALPWRLLGCCGPGHGHLCVLLGRHAGHAHGTTTLPSIMAGAPPASANVAHRKQTLTGAYVLPGLAWPPKVERGARSPRIRLRIFELLHDERSGRVQDRDCPRPFVRAGFRPPHWGICHAGSARC
jgi:hypothetical protein